MIPVEYVTQILLDDILEFHQDLMESKIPVGEGVRDMALLESAINAPFQTFDGNELVVSLHEKAAKLLYGIVKNHAFVDGNKRVAVHAMEVFLIMNEMDLEYIIDEMETLVVGIADGSFPYEYVVNWIEEHVK